MIGVMIVPTGIGAEIGGHAGDATPAARLLAGLCDRLIVHPNVVNASDINEMTENMLYVEGSQLDAFLAGRICLQEVAANKILVAVNASVKPEIVNSVSAARATLGIDAEIMELKTPLVMEGWIEDGDAAGGQVFGAEELVNQVGSMNFDALAIATPIAVDLETKKRYLRDGGVNPWGGVEAIASRMIAQRINKPVAHAPIAVDADDPLYDFCDVVDPRMAAEMVSVSYLHCVLKGLHRAPRPLPLPMAQDIMGLPTLPICEPGCIDCRSVDFMVTPAGCFGPPHEACIAAKIPVIVVEENKTCCDEPTPPEFIHAANYLEAAGIVACMKAGVLPQTVRRPLAATRVEQLKIDN